MTDQENLSPHKISRSDMSLQDLCKTNMTEEKTYLVGGDFDPRCISAEDKTKYPYFKAIYCGNNLNEAVKCFVKEKESIDAEISDYGDVAIFVRSQIVLEQNEGKEIL